MDTYSRNRPRSAGAGETNKPSRTPWLASALTSSPGTTGIALPQFWQRGLAGALDRQNCSSVLHLLSSLKRKRQTTQNDAQENNTKFHHH